MRLLYIFLPLCVPFTGAIPLPQSRYLGITTSNPRNGPKEIWDPTHVPVITFSKKFRAILPENKQTHMTYAQNHHAALDNNHEVKNAQYVNWETPTQFQYHSGIPHGRNKIGELFTKPLTVVHSKKLPTWNTGGIEAKVHAHYADLDVGDKHKISTHARVFKAWHRQDASDVAAHHERATFQYYDGPPGPNRKKVGTPWEIFRHESERLPRPAKIKTGSTSNWTKRWP